MTMEEFFILIGGISAVGIAFFILLLLLGV